MAMASFRSLKVVKSDLFYFLAFLIHAVHHGLVSLVTGGASGLGKATVERLIEQGGKVVLCDLPTSKGDEVAKELGDQCIFSPTDVSSESDIQKSLNIVKDKFEKLDVVVNCAGVSIAFKIFNFLKDRAQKLSDMEKIIEVNVGGTFNVNRLAVEMIAKNTPDADGQRGVIINTSGISAFEGLVGQTSFAASCHAITSMTLPMARDLAPEGIRCNTIAPGYMATALNSTLPPEVVNFIADATPFPKRFGYPEEFAHLVQCIIENSMLNGEVIRLDGGTRFNI
ncbi:3-hydroxyacyl-CoA dehydrogenase type-2 isoform X1 [Parasteatoda tepidariorum]|uniref:3-hydroxyacyl-CoA dehydrogenase type-2 isoform X1 n=1 Tax=Parasteatoda tepidariorum TaxID=114398 RepID=UPI001C71F0F6|nr:3-hydroxyacyl-CoA dehydrogenase type-2 isoform X1 [Parasteatoda tepidariorum]